MQKKKSKKQLAWLLAVTMLLSGLPTQQTQAAKATKLSNKKITITVGKSKTLKLKNKKKNSVKIVALKKGKAKVQVKAGKKKYTCTVTVKAAKKQNKKTTTKAPSAGNTAKATQTPGATGVPTTTKTPGVTNEPSITTPDANGGSVGKNAADVAALQSIIQEQRQKGATVNEDLDSEQYTWKNGRLVEIAWGEEELQGDLDVSGLTSLEKLDCHGKLFCKTLSSLDVKKTKTKVTLLSNTGKVLKTVKFNKKTGVMVYNKKKIKKVKDVYFTKKGNIVYVTKSKKAYYLNGKKSTLIKSKVTSVKTSKGFVTHLVIKKGKKAKSFKLKK